MKWNGINSYSSQGKLLDRLISRYYFFFFCIVFGFFDCWLLFFDLFLCLLFFIAFLLYESLRNNSNMNICKIFIYCRFTFDFDALLIYLLLISWMIECVLFIYGYSAITSLFFFLFFFFQLF